jgi:type III restriction enzyme
MATKKTRGTAPKTRRRSVTAADRTENLLDITAKLRTAPCVPALREAVAAWRAGGYKGTSETTRRLFAHWFQSDHRLANGTRFAYHPAQREAIETLVFVWECERVRTRHALLERYAIDVKNVPLPPADAFARYCIKMATGSGKTKVMALAIAWQFLNAVRETDEVASAYARTFLVLAPNVIVLERLRSDFGGGRIFEADPVIPRDMKIFWEFDCVVRGDGERAHATGTLFLTNIQQFYERQSRSADEEPEAMTSVLGPRPPTKKLDMSDFVERIALRNGNMLVVNDEAHHAHAEDSEWNNVIRRLHEKTSLTAQIDLSATPRFQKGGLFPWTISDYPLKQAILDGIVKRPMRGVAKITEAKSDHASIRYKGYLIAGVERWKEYVKQLQPVGKKPVLFIMLTDTGEADDVGDWLRQQYPKELGGDRTLVIHTDSKGDITKADLDTARRLAREVDDDKSSVSAIVSVLMLREGWDVQNVTVVVGLRPFSAKANILPEQAIGRGLRLMFRGQAGVGYQERVDIIGNAKFLEFVDDLEKLEEIKIQTFELGKDRLRILTVAPIPERAEFDIALPVLSPALVRKKSLADEIAALDVTTFDIPPLKIRIEEKDALEFTYEGFDVITDKKELERQYKIPEPQTAQEVIGYYARRIAEQVKLPAQFAALAPKVREFFERRAFGKVVDLTDREIVRAMAMPLTHFVTVKTFAKALSAAAISEREPQILAPPRALSSCPPFPWSQMVLEARHTIFNVVPCDNEFEKAFARFLDSADDVAAFAKLPMRFGFSVEYLDDAKSLRFYHPDWVAIDQAGTHHLIETKGIEGPEVRHKDHAAAQWCQNATALTGTTWVYSKVMQKDFESLAPQALSDLAALSG